MKIFNSKALIACMTIMVAVAIHAQKHAFGISFNGDLYKVAVNTGAGSFVLNTGISNPNCLAAYQGVWYTVDNTGGLWRIFDDGSKSFIFTLDLGGATDVRGFAIDSNNKNYAVVNKSGNDELWTVNGTTGVGTLIGPMNSTTIQGLAVGFNGLLYAYDTSTTNTGGLRLVDTATGATTDLNPSAPGQSGIQDIFPSGNILLGGRDSLYYLEYNSGSEILGGSGGYADIRGWARKQTVHQLNSATVVLGQLASGNATSLRHRDGNNFVANKFIVPNQQVDPINVEVVSAIGLDHTKTAETAVMWVGRSTISGSFRLSVDIFNRVTGVWDSMGFAFIGSTVSEQPFAILNSVANYYNATNNTATFRYRIKPSGPVGSSFWGVATDMFRVEAVETF